MGTPVTLFAVVLTSPRSSATGPFGRAGVFYAETFSGECPPLVFEPVRPNTVLPSMEAYLAAKPHSQGIWEIREPDSPKDPLRFFLSFGHIRTPDEVANLWRLLEDRVRNPDPTWRYR